MNDLDVLQAVKAGTHVLVPIKNATNAITGRAPLDLSDIDTPTGGEFAVYIDGLSCDEAGALLRRMWAVGYPARRSQSER